MEQHKATVSHAPDIIQSPVHTVSPRDTSLVALKAILPKAPEDSVPRPNSVALSMKIPALFAKPTIWSVLLPAV